MKPKETLAKHSTCLFKIISCMHFNRDMLQTKLCAWDFTVSRSMHWRMYEFAMMKKLREQLLEANKNRQIKSDSFPFFIYFFLSIIAGLTLINERSHHTVEVVCFFIFLSEVWGPNEAKRGHVRSYFFMWLRLTIACRCK